MDASQTRPEDTPICSGQPCAGPDTPSLCECPQALRETTERAGMSFVSGPHFCLASCPLGPRSWASVASWHRLLCLSPWEDGQPLCTPSPHQGSGPPVRVGSGTSFVSRPCPTRHGEGCHPGHLILSPFPHWSAVSGLGVWLVASVWRTIPRSLSQPQRAPLPLLHGHPRDPVSGPPSPPHGALCLGSTMEGKIWQQNLCHLCAVHISPV